MRTLNTHQWVSPSARDIYEYAPDGTSHTNSFGFQTRLVGLDFTTPTGVHIVTDLNAPEPGELALSIDLDDDQLQVKITDPSSTDDPLVYEGSQVLGLRLGFEVTHSAGVAPYPVALQVVGYTNDPVSGALYDIHKIDPQTGAFIAPLCEEDGDLQRNARIYDGLRVDGRLGNIDYLEDGALHHIACMSSAPGKTSRYGYDPALVPLDVFVLINRVVRADFCGDGHPYTYPGNSLLIFDNFTPGEEQTLAQVKAMEGSMLEAVWSAEGVLCINEPRTPNLDREEVVCPVKLLPNGDVVHNWQPPSCNTFVDPDPTAARVYSKQLAPVPPT